MHLIIYAKRYIIFFEYDSLRFRKNIHDQDLKRTAYVNEHQDQYVNLSLS